MIITPKPYECPQDGYDICESCNYLEAVYTTYPSGDGEILVPLCKECAQNIGAEQ
jgi:hypothetical protein